MTVDSTDLGTYLALPDIDGARADLLLDLAVSLCESVITPLPDGADAVVLDVAARAYVNPTNAQSQSMPVGSVAYGAVAGGLWLTRQNQATLQRLAGKGGAFTVDVTPDDALQSLPWWDRNAVFAESFDTPPAT